jgi:SOS-response transcriptional repressor LexA
MISMPPKYYKRIGKEILEDLDIDRDRLGEALLTLDEAVRNCLQKGQWGRASGCCQSAHRLCDTMQTSEEQMNPIDAEYAACVFRAYEGIGCLHQAGEERQEERIEAEERQRQEERIKALLEDAIGFFKKSQRAFHLELDRWNEGVMSLNLGRLYRCLDDREEALFQFQRSLYVFNKLSIEKRQGMIDETLTELEEIRKFFGSSPEDSGGQEDGTAQQYPETHTSTEFIDQKPFALHELGFLPIVGKIAAGEPITTSPDDRYVMSNKFCTDDQEYSLQILKGRSELKLRPGYRYFALEVEGKSMIGAGIEDGDLVILKEQNVPDHNGDIVAAAVIDIEDEATLKKFYYVEEENCVVLRFENPETDKEFKFPRNDLGKRVEIRGVALAFLKKNNR